MLQKKDMRTAMKGGFGAMVTSEQAAMDSAARDVEKRKGDIAESEKTIQALKEEAEKTGQAFADKTKEVMQKMLEAYRAKMDAEQTVENNNKGLVNEKLLRTMRPGAFLINTGRGDLIIEKDLRLVLEEGLLGGVALLAMTAPLTAAPPPPAGSAPAPARSANTSPPPAKRHGLGQPAQALP
jgi:hypothetical protein